MTKRGSILTDHVFLLILGAIILAIIIIFILASSGKMSILSDKVNSLFGG